MTTATRKPYKRKVLRDKITDIDLLEMIISGELVVDIQTAQVSRNGRQLTATIVGRDSKNGTRYRFQIRDCGRKRTIVRSKLVFMAATLSVVPEGMELHHLDEDRYNDAYSNLILLSRDDHKKIHGQFDYDRRTMPSFDEVPF